MIPGISMNISCSILIFGSGGLLGSYLLENYEKNSNIFHCFRDSKGSLVLAQKSFNLVEFDYGLESFKKVVNMVKPGLVINAIAIKNLESEQNPKLALHVNRDIPGAIAQACSDAGSKCIHISTDAVFGQTGSNFEVDDTPKPSSTYGISKLLGEKKVLESDSNHLVVRTNFFGYHAEKLSLFNYFYQNLSKSVPSFGYTNVHFNPLYILDLVKGLDSLAKSQTYGVTHFCGNQKLSKYEFGFQIQKYLKIDMNLILKREIEFEDGQKRDLTLANSIDESTYTYQYTIDTGIQDAIRRAKIGIDEN
jgi:dTDP-4-dehydrorhamnose reductase